MKQIEVNNLDNLNLYLYERRNQWRRLYHYTNLETLIRILRSGKLLLNNTYNLNDNMESKIDTHFPDCNLYVGSLTYESNEDVHYWAVYGRGDHFSVRISFDSKLFVDMKDYIYVNEDDVTINIDKSITSDVIYCQPRGSSFAWKHNNYYFSFDLSPNEINDQFSGMWKYSIWEHEKETRILAVAKLKDERIYLKLTQEMLDSISITFSPWLPEDVRPDISKMLTGIIFDEYGIKKSNLMFRRSSIYNQIKQIR